MKLICWEQKAFLIINKPLRAVGTVLLYLLTPLYILMEVLKLPLLALLMLFNLIWALLLGCILTLAKIARTRPATRPVTFIIALPFLLLGDFIVTISPAPTPSDAEAKLVKWQLLETFPLCFLKDA